MAGIVFGRSASHQVQCWLTVLSSETRPNAKPKNVVFNCKNT